jgi:GNAT superfamily N-acetyltransferase
MRAWNEVATLHDAPDLPGVHERMVKDTWNDEGWLLYVSADGDLAGILVQYLRPGGRPGSRGVWVHPEHQGSGIMRRLFREASRRWGRDESALYHTPERAAQIRRHGGQIL